MSDDPIAIYLFVNGSLDMSPGKIASQAFQACQRLLRYADSGEAPAELRALLGEWQAEGTRTICRIANTEHLFERCRREIPGVTMIDEGIYGCAPNSATIHASFPCRRSLLPRLCRHKNIPLYDHPRSGQLAPV